MRHLFGWSYPPGCSGPPDDGPEICETCGVTNLSLCICLECPKCGECGARDCYKNHGMIYSFSQLRGQAALRVAEQREFEAENKFWAQFEKDELWP